MRRSLLSLCAVAALALPLGAAAQEIRLGNELQVNAYTTGFQLEPSVAIASNGAFVVVWNSSGQDGSNAGVFARRVSSAGASLAAEFQVNVYTDNDQNASSVAAAAAGAFVVSWTSADQDALGVFARRFSSTGASLASEFQVNSYTADDQAASSVAAEANGDFVVVWQSEGQDGVYGGIFARRFSSAGAPLASEFQVNSYTLLQQRSPSLAADAAGGFVVAWISYAQDGSSYGVFARRFSTTGAPLASEFQVNTYTTNAQGPQVPPAVAADAGGHFVVAWDSGHDGSDFGVFAQRFAFPITLDVDGDGAVEALTDTLLALRYVFGFRGATLITGAVGAVGAGCTRCDAPAIEAFLAGLTTP